MPKRMSRDSSEVSSRQKRSKLVDLNSELDEFARDNNIDVNQVIEYLLYQRNYNTNKYLAKVGDELYKTADLEEMTRAKRDVDHTLALQSHINLSQNYVDFCKGFSKDFVHIPNRNVIREHAEKFIPTVEEYRRSRGIMVTIINFEKERPWPFV
ncbi:unnamed protein product [Didymodactylos carnosus]|uniref:Uncharacterized protein n=1 Tax=Didymodactylos carnosus TaxID=1234261 RepID=A0A8S2Y9G5_9BILA|nr:unnamed protein product [Didymodactylos carnosus]